MPELIVFIIGVLAALTGGNWINRSLDALAKRSGVAHLFTNSTLLAITLSLPILITSAVAGLLRKEQNIALGVISGATLINIGLLLGVYFIFSKQRPKLGYFSRSLNIFIILSVLFLFNSSNNLWESLLGILLIVLGLLFIFFEFKLSQRQNNIIYKFKDEIEKYVSIFSFTKQRVLLVEFCAGVGLTILSSFYIVDSTISLATLLKLNSFVLSFSMLAILLSLPFIFTTVNSVRRNGDFESATLVSSSVIYLTLGIGTATLLDPLNLPNPLNIILFGSLILLGIAALFSIWKKIPLFLVGSFLISLSILLLIILSFRQFSLH